MSIVNIEDFLPTYPPQDDPDIQSEIFKRKEFYDLKLKEHEKVPDTPGTYLYHQKIIQRLLSPHTDINELLLFHGLGTGKCVAPNTVIHTAHDKFTAEELWSIYKSSYTYFDGEGIWCSTKKNVSLISYDEEEKRNVLGEVKYMYRQFIRETLITVTLKNEYTITITKAHKLLCNGEWTNDYGVGDNIYTERGLCKIKNIEKYNYQGYVYDFDVSIYHNYFANGILAHNTCASIAVAENFLQYRNRKALVLVKGRSLIGNFVDEVAHKCTQGQYIPPYARTKDILALRTKRLVSKSYDLQTIATFVKKLPSINSSSFDTVVKKEYSKMVIIIDEAQNVRLREGKKEDSIIYNTLHKFLHTVEDATILLLSATPMWDKTNEIATLMNLILPSENQLPIEREFDNTFIGKNGKIRKDRADEFMSIVNGRVSYIRPIQTKAIIINEGEAEPWLKFIKVYPNIMSDFQANILTKAENEVETITLKNKNIIREIKGGPFHEFTRQASNFVYPDGSYGKTGYNKYVVDDKIIASKYASDIKANLQKYSTKFYSIIQNILEHPNELIFVYTDFVKNGGANLLSAILRLFGYTKATGRETNEGKRFALITSSSVTEKQFERIKDIFNSPNNANGNHIQVIIGSRKIGLGITLKRIRHVHILSPHWNNPTIEQAIGRALRLDSHEDMPKNTTVRIYRHVAVEKDSSVITTDIELYRLAEDKDISDHSVYRLLKQASIDCPLTYKRNVLSTDERNSQQCDYTKCNYDCADVKHTGIKNNVYSYNLPENELNTRSYNMYYSENEVFEIIDKIIRIFMNIFYIKTEDLFNILEDHERFLVLKALLKMISEKMTIQNKYGFTSYLKEDNDILFLDDDASSSQKFITAYYVENPLIKEKLNLRQYTETLNVARDAAMLSKKCPETIKELIDSTSFSSHIILLEYAYDIVHKNSGSKKLIAVAKKVVELLGDDLYQTPDGTAHGMIIQRFKGSSHSVIRAKGKFTGEMRCYDVNEGKWRFCTENEESKITKAAEQQREDIDEFEGNKYEMFGTVSKKDGKFRVRIKEAEGKRKKTGQACGSGWLNKGKLIEILVNIDYKVKEPTQKILSMGTDKLKEHLSRSKFPAIKKNINSLNRNALISRASILSATVKTMCEWLYEWFEQNKLLKSVS